MNDITEYDRQGERIACRHSQHYASDGLPVCHDGSQGRRCEGGTVQCGKGYAPCERHADRRDEPKPASIPTGTYTVTLTTVELVAVEMAMEARHDTLRKLRVELVAGGHDPSSIDSTIDSTARLIAKLKRQPADSPALSAMLTAGRAR